MAARSADLRRRAAKAGAAARWATREIADETRRDLAAERLAEYVCRVLKDAPPLTPAQRTRLAALFAPPSRNGGDA